MVLLGFWVLGRYVMALRGVCGLVVDCVLYLVDNVAVGCFVVGAASDWRDMVV